MEATSRARSIIKQDVSEQPQASHSGTASLINNLHQTNGKKKLKGSLALMVGRKPASAGADTSTNVTMVEIRIVLSFLELVCKKKKSDARPCLPVVPG